MNANLQQVGTTVSDTLILKFDKQVRTLESDVDKFESDLMDWELGMQLKLTENNVLISQFEQDISRELHEMSINLNNKFKMTLDFDKKVLERMSDLQSTVHGSKDKFHSFRSGSGPTT